MALAIAKPGTAITAVPYRRWTATPTLRVPCSWTRTRTSRPPDCAQAPTAPLSALSHVEHGTLPTHRRDGAPSGELLKFQKVTWCFTPGTNSCPSACIGSAEVIGLAATSALCTAPSRPLPCGHSSHPSRWLFFSASHARSNAANALRSTAENYGLTAKKKAPALFAQGLDFFKFYMVGPARFELATNGLKVRCSTD